MHGYGGWEQFLLSAFMIHFERSFDYQTIRNILVHPRIYPHISDDYSPAREDYYPVEHESVWYVVARDVHDNGTDLLGLWMLIPQNGVCWEIHTALLPCAWGPEGLAAARMLPAWIWENTPCRRIITNVPTSNRLAFHFALKAGMHVFAVNEASFLKGGVLMDQVMLGLSAPVQNDRLSVANSYIEEEVQSCR